MDFTIFILGLLAFLGFQMWLKDRSRRDASMLLREALGRKEALPPEVWNRLLERSLADPTSGGQTASWVIPAMFVVLAVVFGGAAFSMDDPSSRIAFSAVAAAMASAAVATGLAEYFRRKRR